MWGVGGGGGGGGGGECMCACVCIASFPVPHPAFRRLQYGKWGGPGEFYRVSDVKGRKRQYETLT